MDTKKIWWLTFMPAAVPGYFYQYEIDESIFPQRFRIEVNVESKKTIILQYSKEDFTFAPCNVDNVPIEVAKIAAEVTWDAMHRENLRNIKFLLEDMDEVKEAISSLKIFEGEDKFKDLEKPLRNMEWRLNLHKEEVIEKIQK